MTDSVGCSNQRMARCSGDVGASALVGTYGGERDECGSFYTHTYTHPTHVNFEKLPLAPRTAAVWCGKRLQLGEPGTRSDAVGRVGALRSTGAKRDVQQLDRLVDRDVSADVYNKKNDKMHKRT